ncbi:MAG: cohesin domain-containing protein [Acidobacteriaceae bacterium]
MNRRTLRWALPALLLLLLPLLPTSVHAKSGGKSAKSLYKAGQLAEAKEDYLGAYEDYYQAFQKDPVNLSYKASYERLRFQAAAIHVHRGEKLRDGGDVSGALTEFMRATEIDPSNELARQNIRSTQEKATSPTSETSVSNTFMTALGDVASPAELKPISNEPITLHRVEDAKVVYQTVGKAAGINVLFDPDYTSKRIQVDLQNVSLLDALRIIATVSDTFWRPVTSNTIFVAQNTRAKRTELDEQAVQTFYLANSAQQNDLNDIQTALRNVLTNAKLYAVPSQNAIVMRATPDELLLAQKLINDLDKARPEVVVDVAVLEVSRNRERNLGIVLPQTFSAALQPSNATTTTTNTNNNNNPNGTPTTPTTSTTGNLSLNDLKNLNATNFAITVSQATANLLLTDSDTKVLQNPRVRATDGQKADLKVGSRIPVATGSFQTGAATAVVSSLVNTQFQYLDVGVEIEITPTIHYDRDVSLKLKLVISQTNGSVKLGGINEPIISQRTVDQVIRLREGEVNILGGILQQSNSNNLSGTPGLAQIPILKYLFSNTDKISMNDEIVFMLVPHVVRAEELSPLNLREVDTGTGNTVELRRIGTITIPQSALPKSVPGATGVASGSEIPTPNGASTAPPAPAGTPGAATGPAPGQPATPPGTPAAAAAANGQATNAPPVTISLAAPPIAPKVGSTFQVAMNLTGGTDVFATPMQVQYDPSKLTLVNVDAGDFLGHDGQAVALVHRDDGAGGVAISAARPPGVSGVTGSGPLCVLTFQAKAPGDSIVNVTKAAARNSQQQALPVVTSGTIVHVQ